MTPSLLHLPSTDHTAFHNEYLQVLSLLGDVKSKDVVELGAGIGRFTGELAQRQAKSVLAVDFMEASIAGELSVIASIP